MPAVGLVWLTPTVFGLSKAALGHSAQVSQLLGCLYLVKMTELTCDYFRLRQLPSLSTWHWPALILPIPR